MAHRVRPPALACVVVALVLVGSPDYPALARALTSAFRPAGRIQAPLHQTVRLPAPPRFADSAPTQPVRRGILVPLYASFAALQVLDVHSTLRALDRDGAHEINLLMSGAARRPAAFIALKAAGSAGVIYLAEKVRKRNRTGAIVLMTAINSLYTAVVASNYRVADP